MKDSTLVFPLPLPGQNYQSQFVDRESEKLREFFHAMAYQFKAGFALAMDEDAEEGVMDSRNAVGRDCDSFISEAAKHFPDKFNREEFIRIAYQGKTVF